MWIGVLWARLQVAMWIATSPWPARKVTDSLGGPSWGVQREPLFGN